MPVPEGREPGDVARIDGEPLGLNLLDRRADVDGIPEHDDVEDEAERTELLFLVLSAGLADLTTLAMADDPGQAMPVFVAIELGENAAAFALVVDIAEQVQGLDDAAQIAERFREGRGLVFDLQHPHDGVGVDVPELEGAGESRRRSSQCQAIRRVSTRWRAMALSGP